MSVSACVPLTNLGAISRAEIFPLAQHLFELHQLNLPLAPTFLLPVKTLQALLHKNESVQQELMTFYRNQCHNDYVSIFFSTDDSSQLLSVHNVKGDANFLETLYEVANVHQHHLVLIQLSPQATYSGISWTKNLITQDKNQVEIWSGVGSVPDTSEFNYVRSLVDANNQKIIDQQSTFHEHSWKRVADGFTKVSNGREIPLLPEQHLLEIAKLTTVCKRHFFIDQKISWSVINNRVVITKSEPITGSNEGHTFHQQLAVGTPLIAGYVLGTSFFKESNTPQNAASILVAESLTKNDLSAIKNANGIIVEKNIQDHQVLSALSKFGIPTIINTHFAKKNIRPNTEIILDASHGKVFIKNVAPQIALPTSTPNTHYLLTSYPTQLSELQKKSVGGIVVTSNTWYKYLETHPLQLTKEQRRKFQSTLYDELVATHTSFPNNWMFFLSSLDSFQRSKLSYGESLEELEINPAFGLRGLSYLLRNSSVLNLELEGLSFVYNKLSQLTTTLKVPIILPFTHSIEDAQFFEKIVSQKFPNLVFSSWLHITSLAALVEILAVKNWQPAGIVLDLDYVLSSWHGNDPQPVLKASPKAYQESSLWELLHSVLEPSTLPLRILSRQPSKNLLHRSTELKPELTITKLSYLDTARNA